MIKARPDRVTTARWTQPDGPRGPDGRNGAHCSLCSTHVREGTTLTVDRRNQHDKRGEALPIKKKLVCDGCVRTLANALAKASGAVA